MKYFLVHKNDPTTRLRTYMNSRAAAIGLSAVLVHDAGYYIEQDDTALTVEVWPETFYKMEPVA